MRKQIQALRIVTTSSGTEGSYVVSKGDTLSGIAQRFGVSLRSLKEANNLQNPNTIRLGQKLIIPED